MRLSPNPTHNLTLSDGPNTLGLTLCDPKGLPDPRAIREVPMPKTSMQISQGDPTYGSYQLPYTPIVQKDFSGGRGLAEFAKDGTRFYDSYGVDARMGDVIIGPEAIEGTGIRILGGFNTENSSYHIDLNNPGIDSAMIAQHYVGAAPLTISGLRIRMKGSTPEGVSIQFLIYSDVAGAPGAEVDAQCASGTWNGSADWQTVNLEMDPSFTFVAATHYWLVVYFNVIGSTSMDIAYDNAEAAPAQVDVYDYNTAAWGPLFVGAALYAVTVEGYTGPKILFEYKNTLMAVSAPDDGTAPKLYMNGVHGMAISNAGALTRLKTHINMTGVGSLAGQIIQIVTGTGSAEKQNWRTIVSNTNNAGGAGTNEIVVSSPWRTTHDTTTEFAVLDSDACYEITGHGLTGPVTCVLLVDDFLYFCQGDLLPIRRARFNMAADDNLALGGDWTFAAEADIDATYKGAHFLAHIPDSTGKRKIWYAQRSTSKAASSDYKPFGTPLVWAPVYASAIQCGPKLSKITNLVAYGNPQIPWILKEDQFGAISAGFYAPVPLAEITAARSEYNGQAATPWGMYLFFGMLGEGMIERYLDQRLDDIGPTKDEGLPGDRKGPISSLLPYPGGIYAAINGQDGYSSIMYWNQIGWSEVYRSEFDNHPITAMFIQAIPGALDRLWFAEESNIYSVPLSTNPRAGNGSYRFRVGGGYLITCWYVCTFGEINKYWASLTLHTDDLPGVEGLEEIDAYYQLDADVISNTWHLIGSFYISPSQKLPISTSHNVAGKRIRFKLAWHDNFLYTSSRLRALTVQAVTRVPPSSAWSITFLAASYMQDQQGQWSSINETQLRAQLGHWASSDAHPTPVLMRSSDPAYDNRYVFIDPASVAPISFTVEANGQARTVKAYTMSIYETED